MGVLVEDLLELARLDETKPLDLHPVDLVPIAQDAAMDAMAGSPGRVVTRARPPSRSRPPVDDRRASASTRCRCRSPDAAARVRERHRTDRLRRRHARATAPRAAAAAPATDRSPLTTDEQSALRQPVHGRARRSCWPRRTSSARCVTNLMGNALRYTPGGQPDRDRGAGRPPHRSRDPRGARPRRGHPAADPREDLPALLARRHVAHPRDRRQRAGPRDRRRRSSPRTTARSRSSRPRAAARRSASRCRSSPPPDDEPRRPRSRTPPAGRRDACYRPSHAAARRAPTRGLRDPLPVDSDA